MFNDPISIIQSDVAEIKRMLADVKERLIELDKGINGKRTAIEAIKKLAVENGVDLSRVFERPYDKPYDKREWPKKAYNKEKQPETESKKPEKEEEVKL